MLEYTLVEGLFVVIEECQNYKIVHFEKGFVGLYGQIDFEYLLRNRDFISNVHQQLHCEVSAFKGLLNEEKS